MSEQRKSSINREKDLRLAIFRIQRGRATTKVSKLSISAVAKEAGVSPALIHNHYPKVAEAIRAANGRESRVVLDSKHEELKEERKKNKGLRKDVANLEADISRLASLNEVLRSENSTLRASLADPKISVLKI